MYGRFAQENDGPAALINGKTIYPSNTIMMNNIFVTWIE
jgi:hypothetical protein